MQEVLLKATHPTPEILGWACALTLLESLMGRHPFGHLTLVEAREATGGHQPIVQTPGRAELHHEVKAILVTEMVVERYDVRMIELGESLHLPQQVAVVALFWSRENLNRDFAVGDRLVVGEIHLAEAAATKPASDEILVVQLIADRDHYRTPHDRYFDRLICGQYRNESSRLGKAFARSAFNDLVFVTKFGKWHLTT